MAKDGEDHSLQGLTEGLITYGQENSHEFSRNSERQMWDHEDLVLQQVSR